MNLVAFGLILICCHAWAIEIDDNFVVAETFARKRTKLEDFLEKFKSSLRNGDSSFGIPKLDPFTADKLPIKLNIPGKINFTADLTNVKVDGLSSYTVNSADFKLIGLKVNVDINWPLIVAHTNYSMNGKVLDFEVFGKGGLDAAAHDFRIQVNIGFKLSGKHIQIKQISTKISLRALDFYATGLYDDDGTSEIISKTISDIAPKLIDENQKLIVDNFNRVVTDVGNQFLNTKTLQELLKMLGL